MDAYDPCCFVCRIPKNCRRRAIVHTTARNQGNGPGRTFPEPLKCLLHRGMDIFYKSLDMLDQGGKMSRSISLTRQHFSAVPASAFGL